jgi:hypothetical protein
VKILNKKRGLKIIKKRFNNNSESKVYEQSNKFYANMEKVKVLKLSIINMINKKNGIIIAKEAERKNETFYENKNMDLGYLYQENKTLFSLIKL